MSLEQKAQVIDWIEAQNVNEPAKLYLSIKEHIKQYGHKSTTLNLHKAPEAICESCE